MKLSTQQFKITRLALVAGLVFGISACNTDDLAPPPAPPPINNAPTIITTAPTTANEGQPYSYLPTASDIDGDTLTFSVSGADWLTVDPVSGRLSGSPGSTDVGDNVVVLSVSDGSENAAQTFTIVVTAALAENVPPTITSTPLTMGAVDASYSYTIAGTDANFDDISFGSVTIPPWATFNTDTGVLAGTPDIAGSYDVELTVSDGTETVSQVFSIAVSGPDVVTTELVVFENTALPEWAAWTDSKGPTEVVTVEGDPERDQATKFTLTDATVAGFTARASGGAVGGMPFDASGLVANGRITFELFLIKAPTVPVSNWFFKVEAGSGASARELALSSSLEGHSAPILNTWQTYTFRLSTLVAGSSLNPAGIDLFMVFPSFANAAGAEYLIDNFKIISVVGGEGPPGGGEQGDNLLTNGDFENGLASWLPNVGTVVDDGGNSIFQADIATPGEAFAVNQSQVVTIVDGRTYTLSFRAKASKVRTMIAGIGQNFDPFAANTESVEMTTEWQTFSYEILATGIGSDNSRVLFDMGADTGIVNIDDVVLTVEPEPVAEGDELVVNGDFENGLASWKPDVGLVVEEAGNNIYQADIASPGDAFAVNQSQVLTLIEGATYNVSFRAKASKERTMIAGLGQNFDPFEAVTETPALTTAWQTFTYTMVATGIGSDNSRVLFDMGADTGIVNIDDVSVVLAAE
jgi:hypothetical protein